MGDIGGLFKKPDALQLPTLNQLNPTQVNADTRSLAQGNWLADRSFQQANDPNVYNAGQDFKQWVVDQQKLGGAVDPETQAAVTRQALAGTGTSGILGSRAGTGLVARDLGLTSMQLQQQRQDQANSLYQQNPMQQFGADKGLVYALQSNNTNEQNQQNLAQAAANYKAENTDSWFDNLAKGLISETVMSAPKAVSSGSC